MASDDSDAFFQGQQYAARQAALDGLDSEKHDPEQAARALQLSQATGADPSLIYDDVPTYEDRLKAHMVDEFLRTNPHLQDYANSHPLAPVVSANDWPQLDAVDEKLMPFLKGGSSIVGAMAKAFKENFDLGEAYDRSASDRYAIQGNRLAWSLATAFYDPAQALAIGVPTQAFKAGLAAASAGFEEAQIRAGVSPNTAAYNARQLTSILEARAMRLEGAPHNVVPRLNEELKKDVQKALPYIQAGREAPYAVSDMGREAAKLQSKEDTKAIADLMAEAKKSETRENAPELFKEGFVRPMTEDARFGIDADAVIKLYGDKRPEKDDGLLGWVPNIQEQFDRALSTGADIDIPVADFTAHMPDEVFKELKDNIRARAGGMTPEEAKAPAKPEPPPELEAAEAPPPTVIDTVHEASGLVPKGWEFAARPAVEPGIIPERTLINEGARYRGTEFQAQYAFPASEALGTIDRTYLTGVAKDLHEFFGDRIKELAGDTPVYVVSPEEMKRISQQPGSQLRASTRGFYDAVAHQIVLRGDDAQGASGHSYAAHLIMHEGAHAATVRAMHEFPELNEHVNAMMKETKAFLQEVDPKALEDHNYAFKNSREFVAEAWSKSGFQEVLASTPISETLAKRLELNVKEATIWDAMRQFVRRALQKLFNFRDIPDTMMDGLLQLGKAFEEGKKQEGKKIDWQLMAETHGLVDEAPGPDGEPVPQYLRDAFKTGSALKMNNTRLKAYLEAVAEQHAREVKFSKDQEILKAGQKATQAWKENLPRVTEESRKDLLKRPDISADRFFREGELPNGSKEPKVKLHRDSVPKEMRSRIPEEFMDADRGVHPDRVAERLGHGTGGEMLEHLARLKAQRELEGLTPATHLSQLVDAEAQRRMERDHGRSAEDILEDAKENVFSPKTNDILHHELAALYEQLGQKPITKDALKAHAKMLFDRLPHTMHDSDGYMAEMQRQKETIPDFLLEDKPTEALKAQEKAALLAYHVQFALKQEKLRAQFDRAVKNKWIRREPPGIEPEDAIPIHDILNWIGIEPKRIAGDLERQKELSKYTNLRDYVNKINKTREQDPDTMFPGQTPVAEFLFDGTPPKPLDELTPPEFQAVFDSLKAIDAQSRGAKKIRVKGELQELNEVRDGLIERGKAAVGGKQIAPGEKQPKSFLRAAGSVLLNPESWAVRLDLGNVLGPFNTLIIRPIMEGLYRERRSQREFKELWDKLPETGPVVDIPNPNLFMDPGTNFTTPMKLNSKHLRTIIQNMGNQLQREKLARGYGIVDGEGKPQPDRIWDWLFNTIKIDKTHFDFAHEMGDIFEKAFEETEKVDTARFGVAPQRIELGEVQTPWGTEKEWYHPLIPDSTRHSNKLTAEDMLEESGFYRPSPSSGFKKERTGASYPIDLTFDMVPYKLKQILKYNAMSVPVSEVSKLVLDSKFRNFFKQYYGQEYDSALVKWLKDVSGNKEWDPSGDGTIARGMKLMQENLSNAAIAWNLGTVLKHGPTALIFSMKQVGVVNFGESALRMIREAPGAQEAWTQAMEKSGELPDRLRSMAETIRGTNEELFNQYKNKWTGKYFTIRDAIQLAGHYPVGMVDLFSAVPMWDAAYRSGIKAGMNEADAVYAADTAVRRTHGSTIIGARAGIMRARDPYGLIKTILPFYNFMSNALQRNFEMGWRAKLAMQGRELPEMTGFEKESFEKGRKNLPNILGGALVFGPFVSLIEQAIDPIEQGEDESDIKFWGKVLTRAYPSQIPIVRDLMNALYRKADPSTGLLGTGLKVVSDELKENTWTGDDPAKTWRRTNAVLGAFTGLTNESVGKAGQYLYKSTISGEEDTPKGPVDVYEAYRHGTLEKQPRDIEGLGREIMGEPRSQR
jgi:hypothetical protein